MQWFSRNLAFLLLANCLSVRLVTGIPFPLPQNEGGDPFPCGTGDSVEDTQCRAAKEAVAHGTTVQNFDVTGKRPDLTETATIDYPVPNAPDDNKGDDKVCGFQPADPLCNNLSSPQEVAEDSEGVAWNIASYYRIKNKDIKELFNGNR